MTALLGRRIRPPLPAGLPSRHLSALPYAVGTINGLKVTSLLIPSGSLPSGCELCFAQAEREPAFTQPGNNQNNPVHNLACPFRGLQQYPASPSEGAQRYLFFPLRPTPRQHIGHSQAPARLSMSINWTFCPQNGLSVTQVLPKSPFLTHWLRLCNILRRSAKEPGRKAT